MRASKFRLPERTAQATRSPSASARDRLGKRSGVPDASGAAVADGVEAELLQKRCQAGLVVVLGDDLGAGGEARLDPGPAFEASLDGLLCEQPAATITAGFDVFVQDVIAAITTEPWSSTTVSPSISHSTPPGRWRPRWSPPGPGGPRAEPRARSELGEAGRWRGTTRPRPRPALLP